VAERRECDHCGAPVSVPDGTGTDEPVFCCVGCQSVYGAIREWGFGGYYELQQREESGAAAPGASPDERELERLDDPVFVDQHSERVDAERRRAEFFLEGVHCSGCVWIVEQMPDHLEGLDRARLNLGRSRLTLTWRAGDIDLSEVGRWLSQFGYALHPLHGGSGSHQHAERRLLRRTGVTWAIAANVMLLAVAMYAGLDGAEYPAMFHAFRGLSLVLTTGAVVYGGALFFRRAVASVQSLWSRPFREWGLDQLSIDLPIALGITGGYVQSTVSTVLGTGEVWFDSVSVLIAALLTARWLQMRSRRIAGDAAERLRAVLPWSARRVGPDGETVETVALEELRPGDDVVVRTGDVVPGDGRMTESASSDGLARLQRAVLTGESRPETIEVGESVHAGVRNVGEAFRMRVDRAADDSRIGRLMEWIDDREAEAPVVEWTDRIAGAFVLAVLVGATATWLGWSWAGSPEAVQHAVALLVVACPCALGIATPLAMTTGVGRAAARGLFIKRDTAFQQLDELDVVIFDKTGTVTCGEMAVETSRFAEAYTTQTKQVQLLADVAALEDGSHHPVAEALRQAYQAEARRHPSWSVGQRDDASSQREIAGQGIVGEVGGARYRVGRPEWVTDKACAPSWFDTALDEVLEAGETPVCVARDDNVVAVFGIGDPVREEARGVVEALSKRDLVCYLVSGDHPRVVDRVGDVLGISPERRAGDVSPEEKRRTVTAMMKGAGPGEMVVEDAVSPATVAMVGDGVNDAAALKTASVGIAVGESAQASLDAADVFATRGGVQPVVDCAEGGAEVMRVIRRNLGLSIAYNAAGISLAAAGWVTPLVAAVAMPTSSVVVVISSVLQRSFDKPLEQDEPQPAVIGK
jgi:Cu2+-exporting ATPase